MSITAVNAWIPTGELNVQTALVILAQGQKQIDNSAHELIINLADIHSVDSAGLAVLLAWERYAHLQNKKLLLQNLPAKLSSMIQLSNLQTIIKQTS